MEARYPVHYALERPGKFSRLQLLIRVVAFLAIGALGISFGAVFAFGYLVLPAYAASRLTARDTAESYTSEDGPRVIAVLRWFAAVSAWMGLVAERLPTRTPDETVHVDIERTTEATPGSALARVITGLPSALVLCFLGWVGVFVWLWAALSILLFERVGPHAFHYLTGLQRWSIRLLAYQAALVDEYPPFSFSDGATELPTARIEAHP
jgi:hypothetical protein